jgi:hypothetical protein
MKLSLFVCGGNMSCTVVDQKKVEDTLQGPRFEILVKDKLGTIWRSTYVFIERTNRELSQWIMHDDAVLELGAKMPQEAIQKETWGFLRKEKYTN